MTETLPELPSGLAIDRAAATARPLFLLNEWTWRGEGIPTESDLGAQFSSLAWELERKYSGQDGTHFATSGRLLVVRHEDRFGTASYQYSVKV